MTEYLDIINGVRKNEMKAQMAFYDLFFRTVFQSAFSIIGNHNEAEEIMHDALLKVFSNTNLLHDEPKAMTRFLKRIAVNQAIDMLRKRKDFVISMEDEEEEMPEMEDEEEENEAYDLSISDIKHGISKLSNAYRNIIALRLFEEMSFAEISEQLDINASTVRVQYSRGILKLRKILKQQIYAYE